MHVTTRRARHTPLVLFGPLAFVAALHGGCARVEPSAVTGDDGGVNGGSTSTSVSSNGSTSSVSAVATTIADGAVIYVTADGATVPAPDAAQADSAPPPETRGPTPHTASANFPFPQNRQAAGCIYPTRNLNSDVQAAYAKWKADLVVPAGSHMRVQRTATDGIDTCRPLNGTVSEGIGYGMLVAVYMNDQSLFDNLWLYEQQNLDSSGLMNWAPSGPQGGSSGCGGAATDADEDMAFALAMADKQWGGQGTLSQTYKQSAITQIQKIWGTEIYNYSWVRAGDGTWATNANQNISYFAPSYYRVFAALDPKTCAPGTSVATATSMGCDRWWGVIDQAYATIGDALNSANGNQNNGLVPGWCNDSNGAPCTAAGGQPFNYQYDACRTPFRIGLDWCWNSASTSSSVSLAQAYVAKTSSFFAGVSGGASHIVDGYALNGTPQGSKLSAAFIGPAGVGAMGGAMAASTYQPFLNDAYTQVASDSAFGGGEYYESSWTVMSLLMMTGNFLDYTQQTPL